VDSPESTSPLHLGVIGCGRVFERFHLPAIDRTPGVRLVAACDPEPARLAWAAGRRPQPILTDCSADLLSLATADAVLILTPPVSHAELTVRALEAGIAVLVEKPMALSVEEGSRMAAAALAAGRPVQVGLTRRFREPYRRLHATLEAVDRRDWRGLHFELAFPTGGWQAHTDFLGDDRRGGGVLDDVLSHQVDLLCWLLGNGPDAVRATAGASGALRVELRFGELTAVCTAAHGPYAERLIVELADGRLLEASGSRMDTTGRRFPAWRRQRALLLDRVALVRGRLGRRPGVTHVSFSRQLEDFARAVQGRSTIGATVQDGVRGLRVLEACRESVDRSGEWREVPALTRAARAPSPPTGRLSEPPIAG
jgi:predicted dehydrogenase